MSSNFEGKQKMMNDLGFLFLLERATIDLTEISLLLTFFF